MRMGAVRGLLLGALIVCGGAAYVAAADGDRQDQLEEQLTHAVDLFQQGRWVETKAVMDKLYSEDITDEEAFKLREAFGDKIIREMAMWVQHDRTLGKGPMELLYRAQRFDHKQTFDPANVRNIVDGIVKGEQLPHANLAQIHRLGQYAVPALVDHLREGRGEVQRTNASFILAHLGRQSVVPLLTALKADDSILVQNVCFVLGRIKPVDGRALPALKALHENSGVPGVQEQAGIALEAISGQSLDSLPAAAELFYREANRLYQGGAVVAEEMDDLEGALWVWDPAGGFEGKGEVKHVEVPVYALDDLMAQDLLYNAMAVADNDDLQVLLVSSLIKQAVENEEMAVILDRQAESHPEIKTRQAQFTQWQQLLRANNEIAWTIGPRRLMDVLAKAQLDGQVTVAIGALKGLKKIAPDTGWELLEGMAAPAGEGQEAAPAMAESTGLGVEPLLSALSYPDRRVQVAAANALITIGMPSMHPDYPRLLEILAYGAQENSQKVVLVVSNDAKLRGRVREVLESENVLVMTAEDGRAGAALAQQYPPKDCVLIDADTNEYNRIKSRLAMKDLAEASPLPMIVVTTLNRAPQIADADPFSNRDMWDVTIRTNVNPDKPTLYTDLASIKKRRGDKQSLVILTNEEAAERRRLQQNLQLAAERAMRPQRQSELLRLYNDEKRELLSDIFPVRTTFVNVFVDGDLTGYDAMGTLQALRNQATTAKVPVALLATSERQKAVKNEFERFVKNSADARVLLTSISEGELIDAVKDMADKNPLSRKNYIRTMYDAIATEAAGNLARLDRHLGLALGDAAVEALRTVVEDKLRPLELRANVARALGHLRAKPALKSLVKVFNESLAKQQGADAHSKSAWVDLRKWCMHAIGDIDSENEFRDVKVGALHETESAIQVAASRALALVPGATDYRGSLFDEIRPNAPLALLTGDLPKAPMATPSAGAGEEVQGEGEMEEATEEPTEEAEESTESEGEGGWGAEEESTESAEEGDGGWGGGGGW